MTSSIRGLCCLLRHLTYSFAPVKISTATRGRSLTINISISPNELLAQTTYTAVFFGEGHLGILGVSAYASDASLTAGRVA